MLKRILGLLGWLGVAVVFAAVAIRFLKPEWRQWYQGLALAGLLFTLLYILSQWREIARSFSGRHARLGALAAASVVVLLAILVVVNILAKNHNKRWDLTAARQFSLSEQTQKILQGLDKPLQVRVFAGKDDFERFRERLDEYQYHSKQVSVEYIDAERRPTLANQYQIAQLGTVVLEYNGHIERVTSDTEQALTNGLIKVVQGREKKVYFVQGHGERTPDDSDRDGYSTIAYLLGSENFAHDKLVLAQQKEIPADATVLVVAGPKSDFLPVELDAVRRYLARGGKMLFLIDPPERAEAPQPAGLLALLKEWNIDVGGNVVINMPEGYDVKNDQAIDVADLATLPNSDGTFVLAARYERHAITQGFRTMSAYRLVRSVSAITEGAAGRYAQNLVQTTSTSWAETDLKRLMTTGQVAREPGKGDKQGPISIAAAVSAPATETPAANADKKAGSTEAGKDEREKPETRIAVFGDSDFVTNGVLGFAGNRDMFLNTVNWLAQQENLIAIRPRDPEDRRITLSAAQQTVVRLLTIFVIPGVILLAGVQTWWRRR